MYLFKAETVTRSTKHHGNRINLQSALRNKIIFHSVLIACLGYTKKSY